MNASWCFSLLHISLFALSHKQTGQMFNRWNTVYLKLGLKFTRQMILCLSPNVPFFPFLCSRFSQQWYRGHEVSKLKMQFTNQKTDSQWTQHRTILTIYPSHKIRTNSVSASFCLFFKNRRFKLLLTCVFLKWLNHLVQSFSHWILIYWILLAVMVLIDC